MEWLTKKRNIWVNREIMNTAKNKSEEKEDYFYL